MGFERSTGDWLSSRRLGREWVLEVPCFGAMLAHGAVFRCPELIEELMSFDSPIVVFDPVRTERLSPHN